MIRQMLPVKTIESNEVAYLVADHLIHIVIFIIFINIFIIYERGSRYYSTGTLPWISPL